MEEMMASFSSQYTAAMSNLPSVPNEADMAALQELYSQYLGLYMQYLSSHPTAQYQHLVTPGPPVEQAGPPGGQEAPQVRGPEAGRVINAGGGGAVAAEAAGGDRNRDML